MRVAFKGSSKVRNRGENAVFDFSKPELLVNIFEKNKAELFGPFSIFCRG